MHRKNFIQSIVPLGAMLTSFSEADQAYKAFENPIKSPPCLKTGDIIGICCISGYIAAAEIEPAVNRIQSWGYTVKIGNTIGKKDFTFGGTDAERLADFQAMLDEPEIKAILFARGGYGAVRIIDQVDFKKFQQYPKWIIGFSDVTVVHSHIQRNFGVATIHSKMCNSFPQDWEKAEEIQQEAIESIRRCLTGELMHYSCESNLKNKPGKSTGILTGGNLRTLENLSGTKSDVITRNKILFLEDTEEYLYNIDRMLWNLKRTGKLEGLNGLIIGGFNIKPDDPGEEFGRSLEDLVLEKLKGLDFPVCFDFPVGHQRNNFALKCGTPHQLNVDSNGCTLTEMT